MKNVWNIFNPKYSETEIENKILFQNVKLRLNTQPDKAPMKNNAIRLISSGVMMI